MIDCFPIVQAPSPPNMDHGWALHYFDDTTLAIFSSYVLSPGSGRPDKFKVVSVHPAPNTPFSTITADDSSDIYIRNLTASTRYTVSVVYTMGDATPCKTALSGPLESEVVQAVACTGEYVFDLHGVIY